jgi:hypothetical protein
LSGNPCGSVGWTVTALPFSDRPRQRVRDAGSERAAAWQRVHSSRTRPDFGPIAHPLRCCTVGTASNNSPAAGWQPQEPGDLQPRVNRATSIRWATCRISVAVSIRTHGTHLADILALDDRRSRLTATRVACRELLELLTDVSGRRAQASAAESAHVFG